MPAYVLRIASESDKPREFRSASHTRAEEWARRQLTELGHDPESIKLGEWQADEGDRLQDRLPINDAESGEAIASLTVRFA